MTADISHPEVGRELAVEDLTPGRIVVIAPPGHNALMTMRVHGVTPPHHDQPAWVTFIAPDLHWIVINRVAEDGRLLDDQGRHVRVFEYLGKP